MSDDEPPAKQDPPAQLDPPKPKSEPAPKNKNKRKTVESKVESAEVENPQASSSSCGVPVCEPEKKVPKKAKKNEPVQHEPKVAPKAKPKTTPKAKGVCKRPACSAGSPSMKKPAADSVLTANKYIYQRDGVWGIKMKTKEVYRVWGDAKKTVLLHGCCHCFIFSVRMMVGRLLSLQVKPCDGVSPDQLQEIAAPWLGE